MHKIAPRCVTLNSYISGTSVHINLKFCIVLLGCIRNVSWKFHDILRWSSWKVQKNLLNWHGMTQLHSLHKLHGNISQHVRSHWTPHSERKGQPASPSARPRGLSHLWQPKLADMTTTWPCRRITSRDRLMTTSHACSVCQHLWYTSRSLSYNTTHTGDEPKNKPPYIRQ